MGSLREGFKAIPGFEGYAINRLGDLFRLKDKVFLNWRIVKPVPKKRITGGYRNRRVRKSNGDEVTLSRHRALCLTFKPSDDPEKVVVDHINGVPGDDRFENLEWVTYSENTQRAYDLGLHALKIRAVLMMDLNSGDVTRFDSIAKCYRSIGKDENFIHRRLDEKNQTRRFPDKLRFKYDDGKSWPELDGVFTNSKRSTFVMAWKIGTNTVDLFASIAAAAFNNGVGTSEVSCHMAEEAFRPLAGHVFREASNDIVWPEYTEHQLELYRNCPSNTPRGVLVTQVESGVVKLYFSANEAAEDLGKGLLVITRLCVSGKVHFREKFKCEYVYPDRAMYC